MPLPPRPEPETRPLVVSEMNKPLASVLSVVVAVTVYFGWGQVFPPRSSYMSDRGPHMLGAMAAAAVGAMLMFLVVRLMSRRVTRVRK